MIRVLKVVALICFGLATVLALSEGGAFAARLPLSGDMRKLTLSYDRKPVADVEFRDENDRPVTLEAFRGKVIALNLWASWCVPCREEMPALNKLQAERGGKDFAVIAVAQDRSGRAKVEKFLAEVGADKIVPYLDTSMKSGRSWGAVGLPTTILIDRQGREVGRLLGGADWASPAALELIDALINEPQTAAK
ncbi:MAG TPA: TlpA disulfide reductase family protein [Ferrovibrio sp.]|jgi:thiol-disulfide isomerase/thioredoxin|uniref:TlpA family protein disulfide reductase n=1 Tax=Ferrovibrio sp. TaxID=1917215 RepID=UPI002ED5D6F7